MLYLKLKDLERQILNYYLNILKIEIKAYINIKAQINITYLKIYSIKHFEKTYEKSCVIEKLIGTDIMTNRVEKCQVFEK